MAKRKLLNYHCAVCKKHSTSTKRYYRFVCVPCQTDFNQKAYRTIGQFMLDLFKK